LKVQGRNRCRKLLLPLALPQSQLLLFPPPLSPLVEPRVPPIPDLDKFQEETKDLDETAFGERLTAYELSKIRGSLELLRGTQFGDSKYWFYYTEGVELRWREVGGIAGSNPPADTPGAKKILWLDKGIKSLLAAEGDNPGVKAGLAILMSHEMTHFSDYKQIGSCATEYCRFILENNGFLSGMMTYHELRSKNLTPKKGSKFNTVFLEEQEFYLDVWNYKHGGPKPDISSYPLILKLKDLPDGSPGRGPYEQATQILKKIKLGKNRFSFSEVVNVRYGYKETPSASAMLLHPADSDKCSLLFRTIYEAELKYSDWRKSIGAPVVTPPPTYAPPSPNPSPGQSSGSLPQGGNTANTDPHGGGNTSPLPGINTPPFTPNPQFPHNSWPTSGQ